MFLLLRQTSISHHGKRFRGVLMVVFISVVLSTLYNLDLWWRVHAGLTFDNDILIDIPNTFSAVFGQAARNSSDALIAGRTQELSTKSPLNHEKQPMIIDVISLGSKTRLDALQSQERAFRRQQQISSSSSSTSNSTTSNVTWQIRHFHTFTEDDDAESNCHTDLTTDQVINLSQYCRSVPVGKFSWRMQRIRHNFAYKRFLQKKGDAMIGWTCAIKRPPESLAKTLRGYKTVSDLPDYLMLIDDDTFFNLPLMVPELIKTYPSHEGYAAGGCKVSSQTLPFAWGGFGTIFTKVALKKFLHPLNCDFDSIANITSNISQYDPYVNIKSIRDRDLTVSEFENLACQTIGLNLIGEKHGYSLGMNLADLLYAYITRWNYTSVDTWGQMKEGPGLCLHADWVIGHWINTFYISRLYGQSVVEEPTEDRVYPYLGSEFDLQSPNSQCTNDGDTMCNRDAHLCHHVTGEKMLSLVNGT